MTIQTTGGQNRNDPNLNIPGIPLVGGDAPGQSLIIRSTNNPVKGSVVFDENTHSHSTIYGALTVPNGSIGVGGNIVAGGYAVLMQMGYSVTGYVINTAGSSYSAIYPPQVIFSAPDMPNGIQATGYAQISSNTVIGITITSPGSGYTKPPTITFVTGGLITGSGAVATAVIGVTSAIHNGAIQQVGYLQGILVTSGGSGYTIPPTLTITKPDIAGGRQATAIAIVSGGAVTAINVVDNGSGYLYPPQVIFSYGAATATAVIANPGIKPLVSQVGTPPSNTYLLDFSLSGQNVVFISNSTATTINFDATKGFPIGRQITVYFKNTAATAQTATFTNLTAGNSSNGANSYAVSATRTAKFEFNVLTSGNAAADVYLSIVAQ